MDNTNEIAEPSGASGGYGYAWQLARNTAIAAALAAAMLFAVRIFASKSRNVTPQAPRGVVTVCSGCGTEWESFDDGPHEPITKCPNCPMSEEEWEALKEEMRKRTEKP